MPRRYLADLGYAGGLLLGIVVLAAFGFLELRERGADHNDFTYVWAGARVVLEGHDPYAAGPWVETTIRYGTAHATESVFGYPPWVAIAFVPFALLPVAVASGLWTFGGMALAAVGLRSLLRSVAADAPVTHFLAGLALFASQPGTANVWTGQWSFMLVGALAVTVVAIRARRARLLVAAVAFLGKPHLFMFSLPALARAANARWGTRFLLLLGVPLAASVAIGWLAFPNWIDAWRSALFAQRYAIRAPTTLETGFVDLVGPAGNFVAAAVVLGLVIAALRFDPKSDAFLAVWLAISATAPLYGWSYDHLVLIVPLVIASGVIARGSARGGMFFAAVTFAFFLIAPTLLYVIADARTNESFNAFVPLAVSLFCLGALWSSREARKATEMRSVDRVATPRLAL